MVTIEAGNERSGYGVVASLFQGDEVHTVSRWIEEHGVPYSMILGVCKDKAFFKVSKDILLHLAGRITEQGEPCLVIDDKEYLAGTLTYSQA